MIQIARNRLFIKDGVSPDYYRLIYGINSTRVEIGSYLTYAYLLFLSSFFIAWFRSENKTVKQVLRDIGNQTMFDKFLLGVAVAGFAALFYRRHNRLIRLYQHKIEPGTYTLVWYNWMLTPRRINFKNRNVKFIDSNSILAKNLLGTMIVGDRQFIVDEKLFENRLDLHELKKFS